MDHLPHMHPFWALNLDPGMCPHQESNQWPFALHNNAQDSEPHLSGLRKSFSFALLLPPLNDFKVNEGHVNNCQINFQCKSQTRTPWGYLAFQEQQGRLQISLPRFQILPAECLVPGHTWVDTVSSWSRPIKNIPAVVHFFFFKEMYFMGYASIVVPFPPISYPPPCTCPAPCISPPP